MGTVASKDADRKRMASPRFPTVDEALYELIRHRALSRSGSRGLADKDLIKFSKEIARTLKQEAGCLDKTSPNFVPHLDSFRGSLTWLCMFRKRNALLASDGLKPRLRKRQVGDTRDVETPEIWHSELDVSETVSLLSNWTRFEDVYFLEATALSTTALPEHAAECGRSSSPGRSQCPGDDTNGVGPAAHNDSSSEPGDLGGAAFPTINFALPAMPPTIDGPSSPAMEATNHDHQAPFGAQSNAFETVAESTTKDTSGESQHHIDEDTSLVSMLCSNGIGSHRPAPWIVGKQPLRTIGSREGEVWPDCGVRYFFNNRGWLTSRIVRKWVEEFDESLDRNVALLTSLLSSSEKDLLTLKHVTIIPLARIEHFKGPTLTQNWKSTGSPIHQGIEEIFRAKYRCLVVEKALEYISREVSIKPVCLKTSASLIKDAWDKVPVPVVRRAWKELTYLPRRLSRAGSQPRGSTRAQTEQRVGELKRLISCYRTAITAETGKGRYKVRSSDLQTALADPRSYIWLATEPPVFHPDGKIIDFVRSVCSAEFKKEPSSDDEMVDIATKGFPQIMNCHDALRAANKLAEYITTEDSLREKQALYFIGGLQLELKRLCDQKQDQEETIAWSG